MCTRARVIIYRCVGRNSVRFPIGIELDGYHPSPVWRWVSKYVYSSGDYAFKQFAVYDFGENAPRCIYKKNTSSVLNRRIESGKSRRL